MKTTVRWGSAILDRGFTMVPNILLDSQKELGITDEELLMIIKISRHHIEYKIHDEQLDDTVCEKTLQRRRKSLRDKGYLETTINKSKDAEGTWRTEGITYDFSGLMVALQSISDKKEEKKASSSKEKEPSKKITPERTFLSEERAKRSTLNNTINNKLLDKVDFFKTEFKNKFNHTYELSNEEIDLLNDTTEEFVEAIPYIIKYYDEYLAETKYIPRLIFFLKVPFRMNDLIEFSKEQMEEEKYQKTYEEDDRVRLELATKIKEELDKKNIQEKDLMDYISSTESDLAGYTSIRSRSKMPLNERFVKFQLEEILEIIKNIF